MKGTEALEGSEKAESICGKEKANVASSTTVVLILQRQALVALNAEMPDSTESGMEVEPACAATIDSPQSADDSHEGCENSADRNSGSRKTNKPLMERKRRQRINVALSQLKEVACADQKTSPKYAKMEKADILEWTVKFVENINRSISTKEAECRYSEGYKACLEQAAKFLEQTQNQQLADRLLQHFKSTVPPTPTDQVASDHEYAAAHLSAARTPSSPGTASNSAVHPRDPQSSSSPVGLACVDVPSYSTPPFGAPLYSLRPCSVPCTSLTSGRMTFLPSYGPSHDVTNASASFHLGSHDGYYRYDWSPSPVITPSFMDRRYSPYHVPARVVPSYTAGTPPLQMPDTEEKPLALVIHSRREEKEMSTEKDVEGDTEGEEIDVVKTEETKKEVAETEASYAEDNDQDGEDMWQPWV